MSTSAVIAYSSGDGRWRGVWNHWQSQPQHLGAEIIRRVQTLGGDLEQFRLQCVDDCPEGWSDLTKGERTDDGGIWHGSYVDGQVTFEGGTWPDLDDTTTDLPDADYLYLLDLPGRALHVFRVGTGACAPFTSCVFDEAGVATPSALQSTPD